MREKDVFSSRCPGITLAFAVFIQVSCSSDEDGTSATTFTGPSTRGDAAAGFGAGATAGTGAGSAPGSGASQADAGSSAVTSMNPGFSVPADSPVCSTDLPFIPPGCPCGTDATQACWTGPVNKRNVGNCRDGVQRCSSLGEFPSWGPCEGQVLDCGEEPPPTPPPPPDDCPCVPGAVVGCDEDCVAGVICAPFSTKVCLPDGKFGPCRETLLPTADSVLLGVGCTNLFHGCFAENDEGLWIGDCSQAYTCGQPPAAARVFTPH